MEASVNENGHLMDWMPEPEEAEVIQLRDPEQVAQAAAEAGSAVMAREDIGQQFELASENGMGC